MLLVASVGSLFLPQPPLCRPPNYAHVSPSLARRTCPCRRTRCRRCAPGRPDAPTISARARIATQKNTPPNPTDRNPASSHAHTHTQSHFFIKKETSLCLSNFSTFLHFFPFTGRFCASFSHTLSLCLFSLSVYLSLSRFCCNQTCGALTYGSVSTRYAQRWHGIDAPCFLRRLLWPVP